MTIATYTDLQAKIADFTHRGDLTANIPDFIRLAEDVIYTDLDARQQDLSATLTCVAGTETVALPSDFIGFRSLSLQSVTPQTVLEYLNPQQFNQDYKFNYTGTPQVYTIIGNYIYLQPIPDNAYTLNAIYSGKLTNLSVSSPTNWLLTNYPSVYLYASLVQAAIYMQDANQEAKWQEIYAKLVGGININDWANASPMRVRTDIY